MTVYDAIVLRLSEKRGGNTLPAKAIKTTAKYLSENVGLGVESFISFLRWIVTDSTRKRSFATIYVSARGAMAQLELSFSPSEDKRIKKVVEELKESHGVAVHPDTHATPRIINIMYDQTLPSLGATATRTTALTSLEIMAGVRIGEAVGGGDGHGVLANNLAFARPVGSDPGDADETCEIFIEDSKTHFARYANFYGESRGPLKIKAAEHLRELLEEMGIPTTTTNEDGLTVERPDYWVLRVDVASMDPRQYKRFEEALRSNNEVIGMARHMRASLDRMERRRKAQTKGPSSAP